MSQNLKTILSCILIAIITLFLVNTIYFLFDIIQNGVGESWAFKFKHGIFYSNGNPVGLPMGSAKANGVMILVLVLGLLRAYKKGNLTIGA